MNSCSTGVGRAAGGQRPADATARSARAPRTRPAIDASAPIRARTSPERLVSCVWVTSRLRGKRSARSRLAAWKSSTETREPARVAADVVQGQQPRVAVERRVLDALGHHRRRRLLEARDERVPARASRAAARAPASAAGRPRRPPRGRRPRRGPTTARRRCGRPGTTPARAPARSPARAPRAAAARPRARTSSAPARAWPRRRSSPKRRSSPETSTHRSVSGASPAGSTNSAQTSLRNS